MSAGTCICQAGTNEHHFLVTYTHSLSLFPSLLPGEACSGRGGRAPLFVGLSIVPVASGSLNIQPLGGGDCRNNWRYSPARPWKQKNLGISLNCHLKKYRGTELPDFAANSDLPCGCILKSQNFRERRSQTGARTESKRQHPEVFSARAQPARTLAHEKREPRREELLQA